MKRASAQGAPQAGHFNCAKIEMSRSSVPLPETKIRKNKGKTAKNFLVSVENRSGVGQCHRAGHFDFPKHSKCPAVTLLPSELMPSIIRLAASRRLFASSWQTLPGCSGPTRRRHRSETRGGIRV